MPVRFRCLHVESGSHAQQRRRLMAGDRLERSRLQSMVEHVLLYRSVIAVGYTISAAIFAVSALLPGVPDVAAAVSSGGAPRSSIGQAQADETLEGGVEVLIEDSEAGSRELYFLISGDRRITLRFTVKPGNLTTGERIRVSGRYEPDGTFVVSRVERLSER